MIGKLSNSEVGLKHMPKAPGFRRSRLFGGWPPNVPELDRLPGMQRPLIAMSPLGSWSGGLEDATGGVG